MACASPFAGHHHQVDAGACKQKDWCQVTDVLRSGDSKIQLARICLRVGEKFRQRVRV
jgi:ribosomal protein S14